jgi:hypothetical protein
VIGQTGKETATRDQCAQAIGAVDRRSAIVALFGLCAAGLACLSGDRKEVRSCSEVLDDWLRDRAPGLFSDLTALRWLGAVYLVAHPQERSPALLSRLLIADGAGTVPSRLLRAIARDWSDHHVTVVDGWLLARTEARLCAILHLEGSARA